MSDRKNVKAVVCFLPRDLIEMAPSRHLFGVACFDDTQHPIMQFLAYFLLTPNWVFVFNSVIGIIDNDIFFFLASNAIMTGFFYYLLGISHALQVSRPAGFDHEFCAVSEFVLPEPGFVCTMTYVFVVGTGIVFDRNVRRKLGYATRVLIVFALVIFSIVQVINNYMLLWQTAVNLAIAAASGAVFVFSYWKLIGVYNLGAGVRRYIAGIFGLSEHLFHPKEEVDRMARKNNTRS